MVMFECLPRVFRTVGTADGKRTRRVAVVTALATAARSANTATGRRITSPASRTSRPPVARRPRHRRRATASPPPTAVAGRREPPRETRGPEVAAVGLRPRAAAAMPYLNLLRSTSARLQRPHSVVIAAAAAAARWHRCLSARRLVVTEQQVRARKQRAKLPPSHDNIRTTYYGLLWFSRHWLYLPS